MAAIPHSYLMAKSLRKKTDREPPCDSSSTNNYHAGYDMKIQPLCYSNKMMNSIWGQYNKYSVHNLKAVQDGGSEVSSLPLQQLQQWNNGNTTDASTSHNESAKLKCRYAGQDLQKTGLNISKCFKTCFE
ncbi:hypothetical protein Avbf_04209 [Armadillidium vulgare]|nr:hypothetical protein Avbf_04209 [Armadillidium vulgare]